MYHPLVYALAFTGGFIIMSLELLGGRVMAPFFGNDIYVWGSLITVFMLSLSVGYLIGGRWSVANPSLRRFCLVFLCAALLLVPLLLFEEAALGWVFDRVEDPRYGSLIAALVLFGLPTVVLGMISPYSVRLLVHDTATSGATAGRLYFVSTLGSALGTLATSFYFVLYFEIQQILIAMGGVLVLAAGIGLLYATNQNSRTENTQ